MSIRNNLTHIKNVILKNSLGTLVRILPFQRQLTSTQHEIGIMKSNAFYAALPNVIDVVATNPKVAEIPELNEWIRKLLTHNMVGGKCARGQAVVMAYEMLENPERLTDQSLEKARILGWCCEMSFVCMMDDIMDGSPTRRGKPCWYRLPDVGIGCAVNDGILLNSCMYYLLNRSFGDRASYTEMLNAINQAMLYSTFGQHLDYKTAQKSKDFSLFTVDRYQTIIKHKTAYYTYDLPTTLGLLLADYKVDDQTRKLMQEVSLEIGLLFQIEDDYIDCFGDEAHTGKFGTDIQEGKCSWLAVNALKRCSAAQRTVFDSCYGSNEPAHIERCKQLYCDLQLPELYNQVESKCYDDILERIKKMPREELKRLFYRLLGITYKRKK